MQTNKGYKITISGDRATQNTKENGRKASK